LTQLSSSKLSHDNVDEGFVDGGDDEIVLIEEFCRLSKDLNVTSLRDNLDENESDQVAVEEKKDVTPEFVTNNLHHLSKIEFIKYLTDLFERYKANDSAIDKLIFENKLSTDQRKIVHDLASLFELSHISYEEEPDRYIVVGKILPTLRKNVSSELVTQTEYVIPDSTHVEEIVNSEINSNHDAQVVAPKRGRGRPRKVINQNEPGPVEDQPERRVYNLRKKN
jgi:hypothetical protein